MKQCNLRAVKQIYRSMLGVVIGDALSMPVAVNLGDDADIVGAVYGQMAGAYYGMKSIGKTFTNVVSRHKKIEETALKLLESRPAT